jgi:hypothetical protein
MTNEFAGLFKCSPSATLATCKHFCGGTPLPHVDQNKMRKNQNLRRRFKAPLSAFQRLAR